MTEMTEMIGLPGVANGSDGWRIVHERLVRFARRRSRLEWREGRLLRAAMVAQVHRRLGFGSFAEYSERWFGYNARTTSEKLRVAEALERLPQISRSLEDGELTWSVVRELTRVAVASTESTWLASANGKSCREVEALVAGHAPGDLPSDATDPNLIRHVLRFEVSAETFALFREAVAKLRREAGRSLNDDEVLLLLARGALGGPTDSGRSSYQVEVNLCARCQRAEQLGNGTRVELSPTVKEMCECDAQHVGSERATQSIPPATRRRVIRRDAGRCVVAGCRHATFLDVHHLRPRAEGGTHDLDNLASFCGAHHRAVHAGRLVVRGTPSTELTFWHADGAPYGARSVTHEGDVERNWRMFDGIWRLRFGAAQSALALDGCGHATDASGADRPS